MRRPLSKQESNPGPEKDTMTTIDESPVTLSQRARRLVKGALSTLAVGAVAATGLVSAAPEAQAAGEVTEVGQYLTPEQVQAPAVVTDPTGRVTFELKVISDGTGHGTNTQSPIQEKYGFAIGDEGPLDGVVSIGDVIQYNISYNVAPSATPTTVQFQLTQQMQDRAGDLLGYNTWQRDASLTAGDSEASKQFLRFCQGGSGFSHTGVIKNKDGRSFCEMTFPATTASNTTDGGLLVSTAIPNVITDGFFDMRMSTTGESLSKPSLATGLPHRTRIVGASPTDALIDRNAPRQVFEEGVGYYEVDFDLRLVSSYRKKGLVDFNANGVQYQVDGDLEIMNLPEGATVSTSSAGLSVDGTDIAVSTQMGPTEQYHNVGSASVDRPENLRRVTVKVPMSSIPQGGKLDIDARIVSLDMKRLPVFSNDGDWANPEAIFMAEPVQKGNEKPSAFDTRVELPEVGRILDRGAFDHRNNDWARVTLTSPAYGVWFKDMVRSASGDPITDATMIESANADAKLYVAPGSGYWTSVGIESWAGSMNEAQYCDVFDPKQQRIDTSREVRAYSWNGTEYAAADYTIEYAATGAGAGLIGTGGTKHADQSDDCFTDEQVQWSDTSTEDTDMFRVTFHGEQGAAYTTGLPMTMHRNNAIQIAYVPMVPAPVEAGGFPNYPLPTLVENTLVHKNAGQVSPDRDTPRIWVAGTHVDPYVNPRAGHQNAGTTQPLDLGLIRASINVLPNEEFAFTPELRITLSSAYSSIIPNVASMDRNYELLGVQDADFGPDGLPGTEDDVSDWVIEIRSKTPVAAKGSHDTIAIRMNDFFMATIPAYITGGTELPYTVEFINEEMPPGDKAGNNIATSKHTVFAATTVSQDKWALSPREMVGDRVGWGISWTNTSAAATERAVMVDVLPHNGDGRGTSLSAPLSDIQIDPRTIDDDVTIEVTDHDPTQITPEAIENGTVRFVPLAEQDTLAGEVTALRITEESIQPGAVRYVEVTASTEGTQDGDTVWNNLLRGTVVGMELAMPETIDVQTVLVTTAISGTAFFDVDRDGVLDDNEPRRFEGVTVELVDADGQVLQTTATTGDGTYEFLKVPFGQYTVRMSDRGGNVLAEYEVSTGEALKAQLTGYTPKVGDLDFGFWIDYSPAITVQKSAVGVEEGGTVANGTETTWEFLVTNTGDTALEDIALTDDVLGEITCPETTLAVGADMTCTITAPMTATILDDDT